MGIRLRLTILIAAIGISLSATAVTIVLAIAVNAIEQLNKNAVAVLSRSFKNSYDDFLSANFQLLSNLARNPDFIQAIDDRAILSVLAKKAAQEELTRMRADNPQITELYIARDRKVVLNPNDTTFVFSAEEIKPSEGSEGNGAIRVAIPLVDDQRNALPRSELVAYLDLGVLIRSRIREMRLTPTTSFFVYDRQRRVLIMHTEESELRLNHGRVATPDFAQMLQTQDGFVDYSTSGTMFTGYFLTQGPLVFVASLPKDELYATVSTVTQLSLLFAAVQILIAFILGYFISRSFTLPLLRLTSAAQDFRAGKYATRIEARGRDELASLAKTFNEMGKEIEDHTSNLEILVSARTRELEEKIDQIERLSITDTLTGIYNRAYFEKTLDQEIVRSRRNGNGFGVVFFDLDRFKEVNDQFGHIAGDRVLVQLAKIVKSRIRESDTFARWGGEEFALILPGTDKDGTVSLAETLRKAVMENEIAGVGTRTSSFGCTVWLEKDDLQSIMSRVDKGLYRAKQDGRNLVRFV